MALIEHEPKAEVSSTPKKEMSPEELAENVKAIAKTIREYSVKMRETLMVLHKSGAIDELTEAVRTAALSTRDTAREIEEISKDLKDHGVFRDTKAALQDTAAAVRQTEQRVSEELSNGQSKQSA